MLPVGLLSYNTVYLRLHNEKRTDNTKLAKHKEAVLSELEKLRGYNRAHRKLMVEIWQHLTALARVSYTTIYSLFMFNSVQLVNCQ